MGREHWVEISLNNVISALESGSRPRGGVKGITEGVPSIGAEHLSNDGGFNLSKVRYIPESFAHNMRRGVLQIGDILVVKDGATTGKVAYLSENFPFELACINEHVFICRPVSLVSDKYLFQYLRSHEGHEQIMSTFHGGAQGGINSEFVEAVTLPLPPLNEQKRIVEKLDAILPKVKNAKARLEKIPLILKKFRQSVLSAACSGRLTEDWREGKDLPEWEETSIRNIAVSMSTGPFGSMLHSYDYIENGIPVINPTHIGADQIIPDNSITLSQEKADELSRYKLKRNDILLARRGDLSKCGIVTEKEVNWIAGTGLFILRTHVNPFFFKYVFGTDDVQNILNNNSIGSTMLNLNQTILGNIEILLPPLEEQQEIVRRVEKLFTLADSLEAKYKKAIQRVEKIEQSVLTKAFRGELADPDPNDEPAADLLNRILEEKAKLASTKKPGSKRFYMQLQK